MTTPVPLSVATHDAPIARRAYGFAVAAVLALLCLVLVTPGLAAAAPARSNGGIDRFGACIASQGLGKVLLLIDQSRSLTASDSGNARATAAKMLAKQLTTYAETTGTDLEVSVAGFSDAYRSQLGWTALNGQNLAGVEQAVTDVASRADGGATDYQKALEGARDAFGNVSADSCAMIAWFTDGKLDFSEGDVAARVDAATTAICRSGGIADQLRTAGIVTIGIGLAGPDTPDSDFGLFTDIVTGAPGSECGDVTGEGYGDFYLANNFEDLLFAFDQLGSPGQAPNTTETGACVRQVCDEGKHRFVLDSTVGYVGILAAADKDGLTPVLVSPDGTQTRLDRSGSGTIDIGGVSVDYSFPSGKSVSIDMTETGTPAQSQWVGVWSLVFIADSDENASTRSSIHIIGDLRPALADADGLVLHTGDDAEFTFALVDRDGDVRRAADLPGKVTLSADLVGNDGTTVVIADDLDKAALDRPQRAQLTGIPPGNATLRMRLSVTTAPAREKGGRREFSTELEPVSVDIPLSVQPPVGYPQVSGPIEFGELEGAGSRSVTLRVTGPGCVWLKDDGTRITARPEGADAAAITADASSAESCRQLGDGEQGEITLTLNSPESTNGTLGGTVTLVAVPEQGGEQIEITLPFTASLSKPLDAGKFTIALILALVLGPLIPLLLLYLFKWLTAKIPDRGLRTKQIQIRVSGGSVLRDGQPFTIVDTDLTALVAGLIKPTRKIELGNVTLKSKIGRSPFGVGYVAASAPGLGAAGGKTGDMIGKQPDARLPLAVHNNWVLLHDPAGNSDVATVLLLVSHDAGTAVVDRIAGEIRDYVPTVLPRLRDAARKHLDDGAPDPGESSQFPGAGPGGFPGPGPGGPTPFPPPGGSVPPGPGGGFPPGPGGFPPGSGSGFPPGPGSAVPPGPGGGFPPGSGGAAPFPRPGGGPRPFPPPGGARPFPPPAGGPGSPNRP